MYVRQQLLKYWYKPNRQLAWILVESVGKKFVPEVMVASDGVEARLLEDKLKVFSDYYDKLYDIDTAIGDDCRHFGVDIDLPILSEEHKYGLDKDIDISDVEAALYKMRLG